MKIEMFIRAEKCPLCGRTMIQKAPRGIFPYYFKDSQKAQAKEKCLQFISDIKVDDEYICEDCATSGKADFLCALCGERKTTDKVKQSFGDPEEYLCTDCYDTVPAKEWDMKVIALENEHAYDFE